MLMSVEPESFSSELHIKKRKLYDMLTNIADECERAEKLSPKFGLFFIFCAVCSFFLVDEPKYASASVVLAAIFVFVGFRFLNSKEKYNGAKSSINLIFSPPLAVQERISAKDFVNNILDGKNKSYINMQLDLKVFYDLHYSNILSCPIRLNIPSKQELIWAMREAHPETPQTYL